MLISSNAVATDYFVDATSGLDGNAGTSEGAPWQTISKVNGFAFNDDDTVSFKGGEIWREQLNVTVAGVVYDRYSTGNKPIINSGTENVGLTWSVFSGNVWQATLATEPKAVLFNSVDAGFGLLQTGTGGIDASFKWWWDSNVIYVFATSDPDGFYTSIDTATRDNAIDITSTSDVTIANLDLRLANIDVLDINGDSDNLIISSNDVRYGGNDGINMHSIGVGEINNILIENNNASFNGNNQVGGVGAAPGDGITGHENTTGTIRGNTVEFNHKAGIDNIEGCSFLIEQNFVKGNREGDIKLGIAGGGNEATGTNTVRYNVVISTFDIDSEGIRLIGNGSITNIHNNSVYGLSSTLIGKAGIRMDDDTVTMSVKNNIVEGYTFGFFGSGTGSLGNENNIIYLNGTNFGGTTSAGAGDTQVNPFFADKDNDSLALQATSSAINAGLFVGATNDFNGNGLVLTPDQGAIEFPSRITSFINNIDFNNIQIN